MALVLDTGALIAFDRGDRDVTLTVEGAQRNHQRVVTSSGCVAEAWRGGGPKQALLARLLYGTHEYGLDADVSRSIGALCAVARSTDVVDAHIALLAKDGDVVLTSDLDDVKRLLREAKTQVKLQLC